MIIFGVEKQSRPSSGDHPLLPPHVHMHTAKPPAFHRTMIIFRGACHVPNDISDCPMHPSYICMLAWQPLVGHTHCSGCVRGAAEDKDLRNSSRRQNAPVVRCHFVAVHCVWAGVLYILYLSYMTLYFANVLYLGWFYSKAVRDSARGGIWQDDQK